MKVTLLICLNDGVLVFLFIFRMFMGCVFFIFNKFILISFQSMFDIFVLK